MSREYTAFISYRHCPLGISVAEALHKLIEHYRIPKDLRKDGQKHLGLVFRDRDELPLSSNLTNDIYEALDHSRYLIVVCTPDTPKSRWVEQEIQHFIEKHGRERVLTVLASGTPEESIPKAITHIYSPDGKSEETQIEPLCAFLVDKDARKILKNLKKEFLRLAATLIGCHYDALVQRQKRYRAQQISYAVGSLALIAMLFVGMLVNRNLEISQKNQEIEQRKLEIEEQLLQTQINETKALSLLSLQQLADGDRKAALESALNALPHDGDNRPYSAEAEFALASVLEPYRNGTLSHRATIVQSSDVHALTASKDGHYLVTLDAMGILRCFETETTKLLWHYSLSNEGGNLYIPDLDSFTLDILENQRTVLFSGPETLYLLSLETGTLIHHIYFRDPSEDSPIFSIQSDSFSTLSDNQEYFVNCDILSSREIGLEGEYRVFPCFTVYDTNTFEIVQRVYREAYPRWDPDIPVFSEDGSKMAFVLYESNPVRFVVSVYDTATWQCSGEYAFDAGYDYRYHSDEKTDLAWLPDGDLMLYWMEDTEDYNKYYANIHKIGTDGTEKYHQRFLTDMDSSFDFLGHSVYDSIIQFVHERHILTIVWKNCDSYLNLELDFLQRPKSYYRDDEGYLIVIVEDGSKPFLTDGSQSKYDFELPYDISLAFGSYDETEIVCLVPENTPNTVAVYNSIPNPDAVELDIPISHIAGTRSVRLVASPSGQFLLAVNDGITIADDLYDIGIRVYDGETLEIIDSFSLQSHTPLSPVLGFSEDETTLICVDCIFDLTTHTQLDFEGAESISKKYRDFYSSYDDFLFREYPFHLLIEAQPFFSQAVGRPLLTATYFSEEDRLMWWKDGKNLQSVALPLELERRSSDWPDVEAGGSGLLVMRHYQADLPSSFPPTPKTYLVFSTEDRVWHQCPSQSSVIGDPAIAVGNTKEQIAIADYDRVLRIYDCDKDSIVFQWALPVSPEEITDMYFVQQDEFLLIFTEGEYMTVISTSDGSVEAEIFAYGFNNYDINSIQIDSVNNTMYVFSYSNSLKIDMDSWTVTAKIPGFRTFIPLSNLIIQEKYGWETFLATPVYTCEELIAQGTQLLDASNANLQQLE